MAFNDKEAPAKIICLFHRKTDCLCIEPVTDNEKLIYRLQHAINLNNILNRHEPDAAKAEARQAETESYQKQLDELNRQLIPIIEMDLNAND